MVEGARLESVYTVTPYRGFESLPLRQYENALEGRFHIGASVGDRPALARGSGVSEGESKNVCFRCILAHPSPPQNEEAPEGAFLV